MAMVLGHPVYLKCLKAISMGSVFFGANTYIGNGPNFMVKAIADQQYPCSWPPSRPARARGR